MEPAGAEQEGQEALHLYPGYLQLMPVVVVGQAMAAATGLHTEAAQVGQVAAELAPQA